MIRRGRIWDQRGVTLLEAIVALVIIGSAFAAVLTLQNQLVSSLQAVERAHARAAWRLNAVEIAASIEDEAGRTGELAFPNGARIEWRPAPDAPKVRPNRVGRRQVGAATVTLGPVDFTATAGGQELARVNVLVATAVLPPPTENPFSPGTMPGASSPPLP